MNLKSYENTMVHDTESLN